MANRWVVPECCIIKHIAAWQRVVYQDEVVIYYVTRLPFVSVFDLDDAAAISRERERERVAPSPACLVSNSAMKLVRNRYPM